MLNPFLLPSHLISTSVFFPSIFVKHVRAYRVFLFGRPIELTYWKEYDLEKVKENGTFYTETVKVYFLTI